MHDKQIVILYHGGCPDGFGGAYAAWKKFGDAAEYIPVKHGVPPPENLAGKKLYFVDFCYPQEIMDDLLKKAESLTVLDHHLGNKNAVESMPEHIFDNGHSGAVIAWNYFNPGVPVPLLLKYVEEGDRYIFKLPDVHAVLSYVYAQPFHFDLWDTLAKKIENEKERSELVQRGEIYHEHFSLLIKRLAHKASLVSFEGLTCYLAGAPGMFASDVCNELIQMKPPIGMVVNMNGDTLHVSLRSDPSVDVSALARKHGGNGNPRTSAFRLNWGDPLPWTVLDEHENPRD